MIIWGAIWGALIGVLLSPHSGDWEWIVGALLGALAGWTLRKAVRSEVARLTNISVSQAAVPAVVAAAASKVETPAAVVPVVASEQAMNAGAVVATTEATSAMTAPVLSDSPNPATSTATPMPPINPAAPSRPPETALRAPPKPNAVEVLAARAKAWLLGGNTVARVGAIVLFIGLSFLAKWAADNALFPAELRLAGIGLVGIALLVQGFRLARANADDTTRSNYAILLQGAGVAVLYLTIFAAFKLYAFIPPLAAFVLMAIVCALSTLLALLANKQALAVVGFAGAFATPILVSTGSGNHVALFGYYLLLNVAIGIVAWLRPWRVLNLLGFVSTFLVATMWGALKYAPEQYTSTQPFLIAFFAIYVAIGLLYALRHSNKKGQTLDGMLIFGTPIVSFALQTQLVSHIEYGAAISAVIASAIYLILAFALRSREPVMARWLTLSYAALALIFATLAVPLAVDGRLTAAVWAIEGAGVYWLATQQKRWMGQAFGALMQLLAALAFAASFEGNPVPAIHAFANSHFIGTLMLAIGSLAISWWAYADSRAAHLTFAGDGPGDGKTNTTLTDTASTLFFLTGFGWLLFGVWAEILSSRIHASDATRFMWFSFTFVALSFIAFQAWRRTGWSSARFPVVVVLPFLVAAATLHLIITPHLALWLDALLWLAMLAMHFAMLRGIDALSPTRWWRIVHAGNTLLLILLVGSVLDRAISAGHLYATDWAAAILIVASTFIMLALASKRVWAAQPARWPLDRFQREYAIYAGSGVALLTTLGALVMACTAGGNVDPLPYIPLLNPVDLLSFIAIASVALWLKQLRESTLVSATSPLRSAALFGVLAFAAFVVVNTVWLRFAHHFRGIEWNSGALSSSFFVQAGYSVLWTLLGVASMFIGHRKGARIIWQAGAALLALTVMKLLLVDLANSGGGERIVAFIGVGILMVAVGYFAPLPPAAVAAPSTPITPTPSNEAEAMNASVIVGDKA